MKKIIYIILILLLPIAIIIAFILLGNRILSYSNLALSNYINITLEKIISIYLSILSIEVSAILAVVIYKWQSKDEKRHEVEEIKKAKRILKVLLINATNRAFEVYNRVCDYDENYNNLPFNFVRITDNHISLVASIGHLLTEKEFLYLNQLLETLKDMAEHEKNEDFFEANVSMKRYIKLLALPFYPLYHLKMTQIDRIDDVMNEKAIRIFSFLTDRETIETIHYGIRYNLRNEMLFENCENGCFKVYDSYGDMLCNAIIDEQGIIEGKAKEFSEGIDLEFEGTFSNRQRCGKGTEYFTVWYPGEIKKTGKWQDNKLVTGTAYKVILDDMNNIYTVDNGKYNQLYDDNYSLHTLLNFAPEFSIATISIHDEKIHVVKDSIVPIITLPEAEGYVWNLD